jgi:hypothetical protein
MHCELLQVLLNKHKMKKSVFLLFGPLKISGYFMYRQVENKKKFYCTFCPQSVLPVSCGYHNKYDYISI